MDWSNVGKDPGLPDEPFWSPSKVVSAGIVVVYVILTLILLSPADAFEIGLGCAIALLCIWVPEVMADYEGLGVIHGRPILRPSHVKIVYYLGWVVLLLPAVQIGIIAFGTS